jgi:hypothetical protein
LEDEIGTDLNVFKSIIIDKNPDSNEQLQKIKDQEAKIGEKIT